MEGFELVSCHHAIKGYHENFIIFMEGSSEGALLLYSSMILWKGLLFLSQSKLHDKRSYLRFIISESTTETKWSLDFSDFSGFHHGHHQKKTPQHFLPEKWSWARLSGEGPPRIPRRRQQKSPHATKQPTPGWYNPAVFLRLKPLGGFHPQKDLPKIFLSL